MYIRDLSIFRAVLHFSVCLFFQSVHTVSYSVNNAQWGKTAYKLLALCQLSHCLCKMHWEHENSGYIWVLIVVCSIQLLCPIFVSRSGKEREIFLHYVIRNTEEAQKKHKKRNEQMMKTQEITRTRRIFSGRQQFSMQTFEKLSEPLIKVIAIVSKLLRAHCICVLLWESWPLSLYAL